MQLKSILGTAIVAGIATAESSACNPLSSSCSADKALATSISDDFTSESSNYETYKSTGSINYGDDGMSLVLAKRYDNPAMMSDWYMMFGRVEVQLKSASGTGVISSFYLQSDDLDEIDLEWFGGDGYQVQSNFFSKGNTSTYDRGEYHSIADPRADFHTYTIDWTPEALKWYIDGTLLRTLKNDTSSGYPQTPMRLYWGIWAGGDSSNEQGTIEWAGGSTDYNDAPFTMHVKKIVVSDYSTGSEYKYTDKSGGWSSIEAVDGQVLGRDEKAQQEFDKLVGSSSVSESSNSSVSSSSSTNQSSSTTTSGSADSSATASSAASNGSNINSITSAANSTASGISSNSTLSTETTSASSSSDSLAISSVVTGAADVLFASATSLITAFMVALSIL